MKHRLLCDLQALEQTLNTAITNADISRSFEEYFEIFDRFYADDIMASSDQREEPVRGNASVRALVFNFLVPLHVFAEVGGLKVAVRATPIPGDVSGETHSVWMMDLTGPFGAKCTLTWFRVASSGRRPVEASSTRNSRLIPTANYTGFRSL